MATRKDQKQQSNAKKAPSANPAHEANASVGIAGNEDAPEPTLPVAKANAETSVILAAINDMSKRMEDRFNNLKASLQATQTTLTEHYSWISTMEVACGDHDTRLTQLKQQYLPLDASHRLLQEKISDLEACSRCQNIKVVGLPERVFLHDLLGPAHFPTPIEVDRAHRLGQPPDAGARPHVTIAAFFRRTFEKLPDLSNTTLIVARDHNVILDLHLD
eukprot:superscaffoldBa00008255_g23196